MERCMTITRCVLDPHRLAASLIPGDVSSFAAASDTASVLFFGGKLGPVCVNDIMVFDTSAKTWSYPACSGR